MARGRKDKAEAPRARAGAAKPSPTPSGLETYRAKRAFAATPEPPPATPATRSGPLLFVVQQHAARRLHYDFRLELDGVLKSWAVPRGPSPDPADKRLAVPTEDHPFDYASFEGIIPPGQYGAGEVIVWDCGVYSPDEDRRYAFHDRTEAERRIRAGLEKGKLSFFLRGVKLKGSFALVRTADGKSWLLIKHADRFVRKAEQPSEDTRSVLTGRAVEALQRLPASERVSAAHLTPNGPAEPLPRKLAPMLAQAGDAPFTHPDWLYEPKLDGYRVLAFVGEEGVELRSRGGLDLTSRFPGVIAALADQAIDRMVLDGELIAFRADGKSSFDALQKRAQLKTPTEIAAAERTLPCALYCFDLLHFAGIDLRGAPYETRRRYLAQCLLPAPNLLLVHAEADGEALYQAARKLGFEGIMAKRRSSLYEAGKRSGNWLKIKGTRSAEFVIGGYTKGKGSRAALGALLLGRWERAGKLRFAGHVGTGFDEATLAALSRRFEPLARTRSPFGEPPPLNGEPVWLDPKLVAEVKYATLTEAGLLRAPVFVRLRDDVDPKRIRLQGPDQPSAGPGSAAGPDGEVSAVLRQLDSPGSKLEIAIGTDRLRLTHLDRIYWPADAALDQRALTKRDLLRYLARVSGFMLPHLTDRPLTMIRMPEGIAGERFYQKRWDQTLPAFVRTARVFSGTKGRDDVVLLCNNLATLLWLAQHGTLEFHVTHSRTSPGEDAHGRGTDFSSSKEALEHSVLNAPDYLVFDLDPYIYSGKEAPGEEPELNTAAFEKGKEVAFWLRDLLREMRLASIVKTSGKTGLHVFVPIERTIEFEDARRVCEMVGLHLMRQHPRDITLEWSTGKRTGKIFMDYNMNVRGKTLNAAYSPRGAPGAPISMPLSWEALERAHPLDFRLTNVLAQLERDGDRWHNALTDKQNLAQALERREA